MPVDAKMLNEMVPLARAMTGDSFCQRFTHPFMVGKEVIEEEFNFRTVVARESTLQGKAPDGPLRIRDQVFPILKPGEALKDGTRIFLGRVASNDLVVPHPTVSKLHAYFVREKDRWWLVDVGSSNGTKLNGMRAPVRAKVSINDGDTLLFGRCAFTFMSARRLFERLTAMPEPSPGAS
ncbi:MAG: FHA domain-containing protein [Deltaproteobacteria bacterium]|nr:FHA domain-containing protein [Deltaproteobacteria bacterium]